MTAVVFPDPTVIRSSTSGASPAAISGQNRPGLQRFGVRIQDTHAAFRKGRVDRLLGLCFLGVAFLLFACHGPGDQRVHVRVGHVVSDRVGIAVSGIGGVDPIA